MHAPRRLIRLTLALSLALPGPVSAMLAASPLAAPSFAPISCARPSRGQPSVGRPSGTRPASTRPRSGAPAKQERRGAEQLVEDAIAYLPPYENTHRWFLTADQRQGTLAASALLEAATVLAPTNVRAFWWRGHAETLLAEDARNREWPEKARVHDERSLAALDRAIELDPRDPWSRYARALQLANRGRFDEGVESLENAIELAENAADPASFAQLRYKALEWKAELLVRAGRFVAADTAARAFMSEFAENDWPLERMLADHRLRRRDFAGARECHERMIEGFPNDPQAYEWRGNLCALTGDAEGACANVQRAIDRERVPGLYSRLWLFLLATPERLDAARADLREFVDSRPPGVGEWDLALGAFALGDETVDAFLERARAERARRMEAAEPLDDLLCEAWFYAGARLERDAERTAEEDEARARTRRALDAYRQALAFRPVGWKWEWAHARVGFARLAEALGLEASHAPALDGERLRLNGREGEILSLRWHATGSIATTTRPTRAPQPGDLWLVDVRWDDGLTQRLTIVVDTR